MELHEYSLQPTTGLHYDTFWKCSESKGSSKISKIPKSICKTVPFSLTLQPCSPELSISANIDSKKNSSFVYSEIVAKERSIM